jgi:glycyl-tRNA synthetase beta chain
VTSGAVTYGHRVLATSGPAGRAIEVRGFEDYRTQLLENFVILDRAGRQDKIARELEAQALRLAGRVSRAVHAGSSALLEEVPDLVEYPCVIAGTFAPEFTEVLPDEVLTTTLIHHQHYFPIEDGRGTLKPAFLAVVNTEPEDERTIASNAERVVVARLRDAKFFWEADRRTALEARIDRLSTLLFHKKLGSYKEKAERVERLSAWIAREAFGADDGAVGHAATAARLAKTDLTTDMVREFPELQGTMGGIYARAEGLPEEVWKAIYFHYLPIGVEVGAQPTRKQLGKSSVTWAAVSLADKLDTVVGLFAAGERPTGSRDPYGLRRAAQGVLKTLADLADLTGVKARIAVGTLLDQALRGFGKQKPTGPVEPESSDWECWLRLSDFFAERMRHLLEERGRAYDEVNAVVDLHISPDDLVPATALARAAALAEARMSPEFDALAELFKRVKNISRGVDFGLGWPGLTDYADRESSDAAEKELVRRVIDREDALQRASAEGDYTGALKLIAGLKPYVERYFADVLVMHEDSAIRTRRLQLMAGLRDLVTAIADISEIVPKNPAVPLPAGASRSG